MMYDKTLDVVVIGGGVSGLTAAYRLLRTIPKLKISVLEAKGRVGGRTYSAPVLSHQDGEYHNWDLGGQWVGLGQSHVISLMKELGIAMHPYRGHEHTGLKMLMETSKGSIVSTSFNDLHLSYLQLLEVFLIKSEGGAQKIALSLRGELKDRVHVSSPVTSIIKQYDGLYEVLTRNGEVYHTKYVIVATPPNMTVALSFQPQLPANKSLCLRQHIPGYIIKTVITYQKDFWSDKGLSGESMTIGDTSQGPVTMTFTGTSAEGGHALVVFCAGDQAVHWSKQQENERRVATLNDLSRFFGDQVYEYLGYQEMDWYREPYTETSPVCCPTPGGLTYHSTMHEPHDNIFFAGSESADEWSGFISGAIQAGTRAANEVLYNHDASVVTAADLVYTAYQDTSHPRVHYATYACRVALCAIHVCWLLIRFVRLVFGRH